METKRTHNIIHLFFGKHFSKGAQLRFQFWFLMDDNREEKDAIVEQIWNESPSVVSEQTWNDLDTMKEKIKMPSAQTQKVHFQRISKWSKYAAVAAIIVLTAFITNLLSRHPADIISPIMSEVHVPYGEQRQVQLPDGTIVWVNAGSILIYPSQFISDTRSVYLSGEARFKVVKNPKKPFIVSTNYINVRALGTVFVVDAYPNSLKTTATLEEGSIRVDTKRGKLTSSILNPYEQLVYSNLTDRITINKVEAQNLSAWKDGYLVFENASFKELVNALERKYNVTINYNAAKYQNNSYFVKFNPNESIEDAMLILSHLIDGFHYTISERTISIR